jgi:acetylornithine deacetylase/succinyl-diaminopimelate desuccinylase-like protein
MTRKHYAIASAVAAIVAGGIVWYSLYLKSDIDSQLYIPKKEKITPEIVRLQEYVRIDTSNPPGNEIAGARFLAGILAKNGIPAEIIESAPGRGNVYARIRGKRPGEGLLLLHHIDVVPAPPQGWTRPPFAASIYLNMLYGRGSLDMKGIGICELEAFLDVARGHRVPERDIIFLAVADEEEGGHMGTEWLLAHRPDLFEGIRYAINEGGITETREEKISYIGIEIGTKLAAGLRLRARDRATMQRVRIALEPSMTPRDPDRVLPEVRTYLHEIAPLRREQGRWLTNIDATIANGKFWLINRGVHELTQNVIWMDGVREDDKGATMRVTLLNLPDENPDARIVWLRSQIAPLGGTVEEVVSKFGPAPLSSLNTPFFRVIAAESRRALGDVRVGPQILAVSSNDSRYLRARGINAYGIWPFPVDFYQTLGIHSIDERVRLDWFMEGVGLMKGIVTRWAFSPQPEE